MKFFIFIIISAIIASCFIFGTEETFGAIYGRYPFWATLFTVLIVIYILISRNKKFYNKH
jgi:hypothetical protein